MPKTPITRAMLMPSAISAVRLRRKPQRDRSGTIARRGRGRATIFTPRTKTIPKRYLPPGSLARLGHDCATPSQGLDKIFCRKLAVAFENLRE
jgi:hypothetical protein